MAYNLHTILCLAKVSKGEFPDCTQGVWNCCVLASVQQGVGYKEMFKYFDGEWSLATAIEKIQRNTRIYAKKQLTWYKKDHDMNWFNPDDTQSILSFILHKIHPEENKTKKNT